MLKVTQKTGHLLIHLQFNRQTKLLKNNKKVGGVNDPQNKNNWNCVSKRFLDELGGICSQPY